MVVQLAAVVLTKNEARHIGECLSTLGFADQVVLSDSYSDDGTVEIARAAGGDEPHAVVHRFGQVYLVGDPVRGAIRAFHKHEELWDWFCIV
ncbi:MAG: hypothetical protein WHX53_08835, partial [Anaerolineae bacterium]